MKKSVLRLGLAAVVAFYVIVTGLFIQAYIPLQRFYSHADSGSSAASSMSSKQMLDALSYPANEMKVRRYGSVLLWGTVGIAAFGGVVVVTRQRKRGDVVQSARGDAQ